MAPDATGQRELGFLGVSLGMRVRRWLTLRLSHPLPSRPSHIPTCEKRSTTRLSMDSAISPYKE